MERSYLEIGEVYREHGIDGAVKVFVYSNDTRNFKAGMKVQLRNASGAIQEATIRKVEPYQKWFLTRFSCWTNPEQAKEWRKATILVDRKDLTQNQDGEFYLSDLMGFKVQHEDLKPIGTLTGFEAGAPHEFWAVEGEMGSILIPAISDWIRKIDAEAKTITVRLPEGFIEAQLPEKK